LSFRSGVRANKKAAGFAPTALVRFPWWCGYVGITVGRRSGCLWSMVGTTAQNPIDHEPLVMRPKRCDVARARAAAVSAVS
jgi:hypothetical protein